MITKCLCTRYGGIRTNSMQEEVIGRKDDRTIVKCTQCGLIRTFDVPDDYIDLYTKGTTYHEGRDGHEPYKDRLKHDMGIGNLRLNKIHAQYTILDVGCANGGFLWEARLAGYNVEGLEVNPIMAEFVRNQVDCTVHESWDTVKNMYDYITYHDVLEHSLEPLSELRTAIGRLYYDNGMLIVDVPDSDDPRFAELGMDWHHMKPREHIWFFNQENLTRLLHAAGLTVCRIDRPIQGKLVAYCEGDQY